MNTTSVIVLSLVVVWAIYRNFFKRPAVAKLSDVDMMFSRDAVEEGFATLGFAIERNVDTRAEAALVGRERASGGDIRDAITVLTIALGIAGNYMSNKSATKEHIALLMNEINELVAEKFKLDARNVWDGRALLEESLPNLGFLTQKAFASGFNVAQECRESDVLAEIVASTARGEPYIP